MPLLRSLEFEAAELTESDRRAVRRGEEDKERAREQRLVFVTATATTTKEAASNSNFQNERWVTVIISSRWAAGSDPVIIAGTHTRTHPHMLAGMPNLHRRARS